MEEGGEMLLFRNLVYLPETNENRHQEADAKQIIDNGAMYLTFFGKQWLEFVVHRLPAGFFLLSTLCRRDFSMQCYV